MAFSQQIKSTQCCSAPAIPVLEEATETMRHFAIAVATCQSTFNFDDFLVLSDIILVGKER